MRACARRAVAIELCSSSRAWMMVAGPGPLVRGNPKLTRHRTGRDKPCDPHACGYSSTKPTTRPAPRSAYRPAARWFCGESHARPRYSVTTPASAGWRPSSLSTRPPVWSAGPDADLVSCSQCLRYITRAVTWISTSAPGEASSEIPTAVHAGYGADINVSLTAVKACNCARRPTW